MIIVSHIPGRMRINLRGFDKGEAEALVKSIKMTAGADLVNFNPLTRHCLIMYDSTSNFSENIEKILGESFTGSGEKTPLEEQKQSHNDGAKPGRKKSCYKPVLHVIMLAALVGTYAGLLIKSTKLHAVAGIMLTAAVADHSRVNRRLLFKPTYKSAVK